MMMMMIKPGFAPGYYNYVKPNSYIHIQYYSNTQGPIFSFVHKTFLFLQYDAMQLPGQQLPAAHAYTSLDHVLNLDIKAPPGCQRLTGIFTSVGMTSF